MSVSGHQSKKTGPQTTHLLLEYAMPVLTPLNHRQNRLACTRPLSIVLVSGFTNRSNVRTTVLSPLPSRPFFNTMVTIVFALGLDGQFSTMTLANLLGSISNLYGQFLYGRPGAVEAILVWLHAINRTESLSSVAQLVSTFQLPFSMVTSNFSF